MKCILFVLCTTFILPLYYFKLFTCMHVYLYSRMYTDMYTSKYTLAVPHFGGELIVCFETLCKH